ncbi:hypothetical protein BsWGS_23613 [Bradybaena similaris]
MAAFSPTKSSITTLSMPGQSASTESLSPNAKTPSSSSALDVKPSQKLLDQFMKDKFNTSTQGASSSTLLGLPAHIRARALYINSHDTYARKLRRVKRVIKDTIFLNGAICDEVLRTEEKLAKAKEERRFLLRKLLQYQSVTEPISTSVKTEAQTPVSRLPKGAVSGGMSYDTPPSDTGGKPKPVKRKMPASASLGSTPQHPSSAGLLSSSLGLGGSGELKKKQGEPHARPKKGKGANKKVIPPLMLDSLGRPIFPMALGDITLHSIGEIVPDRLSFHCPESIYPVGYCITRVFASLQKLDSKCLYTCKISDNNDGPIFEIAAEDSSDIVFKSISPIECHNLLIRAVNKSRGGNILPVDGHGLDFFGLSHPVVQNLIQSCPGSRKCSRYKWVKFEINKQETNENVGVGLRDPTVSYEALKSHLLAAKYAALANT